MKQHICLAIVLITGTHLCSPQAQTAQASHHVSVTVTHIDRNEFGFLISVDIANLSEQTLFLPQASEWLTYKYGPRVNSLNVEQWSDGKTNLPPKEQMWPVSRAGYYSVGPCRDVGSSGWVRLSPREHIADRIQAFDPSSVNYGNSVCPIRFAHLGDKLRLSIRAFPSAHWQISKAIDASTEFSLPNH
jgi:hypothetical protein